MKDLKEVYRASKKDIRRIIYTTNIIESFNRQIRKVTKTKGAFTNDTTLMKLVFLIMQNITDKWTQPIPNYSLTISQLQITFGDRFKYVKQVIYTVI